MTITTSIRETEEFWLRSRRLGKPKNRGKEYAILEAILKDPYPMQLTKSGPCMHFPDTEGWVYFNIERLIREEPVSRLELANAVATVDKVVISCWQLRDARGNLLQPNIASLERMIALYNNSDLPMSLAEAKTTLHYIVFKRPDYTENLWVHAGMR